MKHNPLIKPIATLAAISSLLLVTSAQADFIAPVGATASSQYTPDGRLAVNAANWSGMTGTGTAATHNASNNNMWLTNAQVAGAWIRFDLGDTYTSLEKIYVWNYNENHSVNANNKRGVNAFTVDVSSDGVNWAPPTSISATNMAQNPSPGYAAQLGLTQTIDIAATNVRYLRINIASNHGGDNFVGLSEVAFEASLGPDVTPPAISSLTPADDEPGFFAGSNLVAVFDEPIQAGTGNITIKDLDTPNSIVIPVTDSQVTISDGTLTINPTADLLFGTNYAIQIDAGAITDQAETPNAFAGIADDTTWNFTTLPEDFTAPVVNSLSPADDSPAVIPTVNLVVTFDEDIQVGTGNITIKNLTDATETVIAVTDGSQVTISGKVLTINPTANLAGGKDLAVRIDATAIENLSGIAYVGIADDTTWNFTTLNGTNMTANGNWVDGSKWDAGVPVAGLNAIIAPGVTATANGNVGAWSGDLTIKSGATLDVQGTAANFIALDGAANVFLDGGVLLNNFKSRTVTSNFILSNGGRFNFSGNASFNQDQRFSGVFSGTGGFAIKGGNHTGFRFQATNTFTGGLTLETGGRHGVEFSATGAAGAGDVTAAGNANGTGVGAVIIVNALDPFAHSAKLTLNCNGFDNSTGGFGPFTRFLGTAIRIEMLNNATVSELWIDNVQQEAGTYTGTSGAWISGTGVLTVLNGPGGPGGADYATWAALYPSADLTDPQGDFDGDGVSNDDERLFGLDPTDPASVNPITVALDPGAGTFSFTRRDDELTQQYSSIETSTDLVTWTRDSGAALVAGTPDGNGIETVAVTLSPGLLTASRLFVRVIQDEGILLSANFESDNGGFTVATTSGSAWAHGDPDSSGAGGAVTGGNGGSTQCWGTNIGNPGYFLDGTVTCLRSTPIDLTGITAAEIMFAEALDLEAGDTAVLNIIDGTTDTVIASAVYTATDSEISNATWAPANGGNAIAMPAAALGNAVRLEWCLTGFGGTSDDYMGWYVDDVSVKRAD